VGDSVLVDVADALRRRLRGVDVAARLGGDEFALLLSETDADQATVLLQSLLGQVVPHFDATGVPVRLSVGSVTFQTPPMGLAEALRQADELLYEAKRDGKGRMRHKNCP
jgi:diguanylate cyclase (GGDEF)-like protein